MPVLPFSSVYPERDREVRAILARAQAPSAGRVEELLAKSRSEALELAELAELLEIGVAAEGAETFDILRTFVLKTWRRPEGNRVRYVAPVYVSSFCDDTCAYCNFSAARRETVRRRLTLEEIREEVASVMAAGARVVELVYASDPEMTQDLLALHTEKLVEAIEGLPGSGALLCTEHLSARAYRALKDAGLNGIVQWDETLDEAAYSRWHSSSPRKREFLKRMDTHDRALAAGLDVATGALFGLADFRYDALMQIAKARHFLREHGRGPFVFGAARLKPIAGHDLRLATSVSDRAYETALMVYKIAAPRAGRWLQTREAFELNLRNLLDGDVFTYRCGDVTPGGYQGDSSRVTLRGGQFSVHELERTSVEGELTARNFRIDYAWMRHGRPSGAAFMPAAPSAELAAGQARP